MKLFGLFIVDFFSAVADSRCLLYTSSIFLRCADVDMNIMELSCNSANPNNLQNLLRICLAKMWTADN